MNSGQRASVLLIGFDRYIMEACVRMGVDAVVACGPRGRDSGLVPVPRELTTVRVDDDCNPESILAARYRAGLGDRRFDGVQTSVEFAATTAALLAVLTHRRVVRDAGQQTCNEHGPRRCAGLGIRLVLWPGQRAGAMALWRLEAI